MTPRMLAADTRCASANAPPAILAEAPAITRDGGTDVVFI